MYQELYQGSHPNIATSLNNVGIAQGNLGKVKEGLRYFWLALKMRQKLYQGNHPSIADSLSNIGVIYEKLGDISRGLGYKKEALTMQQKLYQGNHVAIATSLNNVGTAYDKLGYIFVSLKYFESGLKMFQELHQGNHPDIAGFLTNIGLAYHKLDDAYKAIELYKQAYLMRVQTLGAAHPDKELKSYLEKIAPEFIKNNETREFILQRGDFKEVTLEIKQKLQKEVLNKIFINAAKYKWSSKCSILGNWGVKGYLGDRYLAKQLGALANVKNIEIAKMLCFEAICLIAIYNPNKNFTCVKEFTRAYPELINKITNEHPEYFIDGSILRICVDNEAVLNKLLGSG
ncbi:hypothetical protein H6P87_00027 [Rickettsia tillamookensis]|uniref:Tetratricopeptide repeat family protein n=1 Tax=Rickettsia tillamookensis TaxID=2761623 RepID=A0A9E6MFX6_9RICK|nr:tetratricopeptide repeat protein [Rickettsia tillamookensis]QQV74493.1 hypothetical protein H6P87_00027 [Rickettsia tillamookensis]